MKDADKKEMAFHLFNLTNIAFAKGMPELAISLDEVAIRHDLTPFSGEYATEEKRPSHLRLVSSGAKLEH